MLTGVTTVPTMFPSKNKLPFVTEADACGADTPKTWALNATTATRLTARRTRFTFNPRSCLSFDQADHRQTFLRNDYVAYRAGNHTSPDGGGSPLHLVRARSAWSPVGVRVVACPHRGAARPAPTAADGRSPARTPDVALRVVRYQAPADRRQQK